MGLAALPPDRHCEECGDEKKQYKWHQT
jgi:hypothetical protein